MPEDAKTFGDLGYTQTSSALNSLKRESIDRMKAALLSASLDDPLAAASSIRQVTVLRIYHQVARIVQYLDLMDDLEDKLYESIDNELVSADTMDRDTLSRLLLIQERLQKSIIESNKLLQPYLDMEQYPAFEAMEATVVDSKRDSLNIPTSDRIKLRENAGEILTELRQLQTA